MSKAMPRPMPRAAPVTMATLPETIPGMTLVSPHLARDLDDHPQLGPLLFLGEVIAFLGRSEAALRRQAELIERDIFRRLVDAALEFVLCFQRAGLGRHQPERSEEHTSELQSQ